MAKEDLAKLFAFGNNAALTPGSYEHTFVVNMPKDVERIASSVAAIQKTNTKTLRQLEESHKENFFVLNEIRRQIELHAEVSRKGFQNITEAVVHLEDTLGTHLSDIKWVLGNLDEKIAQLVDLVKFPRQTEARELINDGLKALSVNNLDDAETCLIKAAEIKTVSFEVHFNLALLFLHKNNGETALAHFQKAIDYAGDHESRIFALENKARMYYALKNFTDARNVMQEAMEMRTKHNLPSHSCEYHLATYSALNGDVEKAIANVVRLCKKDHKYFAISSADADLEPIREPLLEALNGLAREAHDGAMNAYYQAQAALHKITNEMEHQENVKKETDEIKNVLEKSWSMMQHEDYWRSWLARTLLAFSNNLLPILPDIAKLRHDIEKTKEQKDGKSQNFNEKLTEWKSKKTYRRTIIPKLILGFIIFEGLIEVVFYDSTLFEFILTIIFSGLIFGTWIYFATPKFDDERWKEQWKKNNDLVELNNGIQEDSKKLNDIEEQLREIQKEYNIHWDHLITNKKYIREKGLG